MIILLIKSLATGLIAGLVFTLFKLPLPAPSALAGIIGIAGMYIGYLIAHSIVR